MEAWAAAPARMIYPVASNADRRQQRRNVRFRAGSDRSPKVSSTSADLAFPETRGERPENFDKSRQFEAALFRAVVTDPVVHRAMIEVGQLLQPHDLLHQPHIMERIEAASAKAVA
jgi:hypothetical protein